MVCYFLYEAFFQYSFYSTDYLSLKDILCLAFTTPQLLRQALKITAQRTLQQNHTLPDIQPIPLYQESLQRRTATQPRQVVDLTIFKFIAQVIQCRTKLFHNYMHLSEQQISIVADVLAVSQSDDLYANHVAMGVRHNAMIERNSGQIYTWGYNYKGCLGQPYLSQSILPDVVWIKQASGLVIFKQRVLNISCGGLHTALVTTGGELFTFGAGRNGQLGNCSCVKGFPSRTNIYRGATARNTQCDSNVAKRVLFEDPETKIVQVTCGEEHTAALSSRGEIYSFGCAADGRLGHLKNYDSFWGCVYQPSLAETNGTYISQVKSGPTSSFTVAVGINGEVLLSQIVDKEAAMIPCLTAESFVSNQKQQPATLFLSIECHHEGFVVEAPQTDVSYHVIYVNGEITIESHSNNADSDKSLESLS